ncbi:MAG: hypothetical protein ACRCYS_04875, partial [Beijerinckiaceae bacterium]
MPRMAFCGHFTIAFSGKGSGLNESYACKTCITWREQFADASAPDKGARADFFGQYCDKSPSLGASRLAFYWSRGRILTRENALLRHPPLAKMRKVTRIKPESESLKIGSQQCRTVYCSGTPDGSAQVQFEARMRMRITQPCIKAVR